MRIVVVVFLLGLMQSALAITKCEQGRKVTYKRGTCPENASSKYLVKDKFVAEEHMQQHQKERMQQSQQAFKDMNTPKKKSDEELQETELKPAKVQMSNEAPHFQLQEVDKENSVERSNSQEDQLNTPEIYDGTSVKLSEMEKKLQQRNKELQQLQKQ